MIICIEGPDKVGKGTQAKILAKRLGCKHIRYPNYESDTGALIREILDGKVHTLNRDFQILQARDKIEDMPRLKYAEETDGYVVLERYTPSTYVYGLVDGVPLEDSIVMSKELPVPDLTIVLYGPPWNLKEDRYENKDTQDSVREFYMLLAKPFQWQLVDSTATIEAVSDVIWKKVIDFDMPKLGM